MNDPEVKRYLRAARQRLTSAQILFQNQMFLDAIYLAGYVPECALKALLLTRIPVKTRAKFVSQYFRGAGAHNFDNLLALLRTKGINIPLQLMERIRGVRTWSTDMRYETGHGNAADANAFLNSCLRILEWAERSI